MAIVNNLMVHELAEAALNNYELSCSWESAKDEIIESCQEFYSIMPSKMQVYQCLNVAKYRWNETKIETKKAIEEK